jgi:hypothetical protein
MYIELASGHVCSRHGYLGAVRAMAQVANPQVREVLREQFRRTVHHRVSRHLDWYQVGRKWQGVGHD